MTETGDRAEQPLDVGGLLDVLARHSVDYVVIGGVATQVHGHRRTTMGLDLTPDPDPENLSRLAAALVDLDARPHGRLNIVKEPKGARAFGQLREAALVVELDGIEVAIASLDDLIRMKRAAGRPSDLADIAAVSEVERQQD